MKQFTTLRILALALMMLSTRAGDGSDGGGCDGTDCQGSEGSCQGSDGTNCQGSEGSCQGSDGTNCQGTEHCMTQDSRGCEGCLTHDTNGTEGCVTQDCQASDQTCCYQGPQVNGAFWDGPCGTDSNPCCVEYRVGPFVYVDPIIDPTPLVGGGGSYVPPRYNGDARGSGRADWDGYMPPAAGVAASRPDFEDQDWICQNIGKSGVPCGFQNSPFYNRDACGMCFAPRPVSETPAVAQVQAALDGRDPLSIESAPVAEGTERTGMCCVCMEHVNDVVLLGAKDTEGQYKCRHQCMCRGCARTMSQLPRALDRRCPMCRAQTHFYVISDTVPQGFKTYRD